MPNAYLYISNLILLERQINKFQIVLLEMNIPLR